ncbi:MAG: DinB family protein [Dehalococcoidia bacterium]
MSEVEVLAKELRWALHALAQVLREGGDEVLNRRPTVPEANSPAAIVAHAAAVGHVYVLGLGSGYMVDRDRPAEFQAEYRSVAEALADLGELAGQMTNALAYLPPSALGQMVAPERKLWGTGDLWVVSRRECITHALRHTAVHVGELRLTMSLLRAGP